MKKLIYRSPGVETLEARSLLSASPWGHALSMPHAALGPLPGGMIHAVNLPGMPGSRREWAAALRAERAAFRQANMLRLQEMRSAFRFSPMPLAAAPPLVLAAPNPAMIGPPAAVFPTPVFGSMTPPPSATPLPLTVGPPATVPVPLPAVSIPTAAPIAANLDRPAPTIPPAAPIAVPPAAPAPTAADSPIVVPTAGSVPEPVLPGGTTGQSVPAATPTGGTAITLGTDSTAQVSGTLAAPGSSDVYTFQAPSAGRLTFSFPGGGDPVKLTARSADGMVLLTILLDRPNFISSIMVAAGASYTFTLDPIGSTPASYTVTMRLS